MKPMHKGITVIALATGLTVLGISIFGKTTAEANAETLQLVAQAQGENNTEAGAVPVAAAAAANPDEVPAEPGSSAPQQAATSDVPPPPGPFHNMGIDTAGEGAGDAPSAPAMEQEVGAAPEMPEPPVQPAMQPPEQPAAPVMETAQPEAPAEPEAQAQDAVAETPEADASAESAAVSEAPMQAPEQPVDPVMEADKAAHAPVLTEETSPDASGSAEQSVAPAPIAETAQQMEAQVQPAIEAAQQAGGNVVETGKSELAPILTEEDGSAASAETEQVQQVPASPVAAGAEAAMAAKAPAIPTAPEMPDLILPDLTLPGAPHMNAVESGKEPEAPKMPAAPQKPFKTWKGHGPYNYGPGVYAHPGMRPGAGNMKPGGGMPHPGMSPGYPAQQQGMMMRPSYILVPVPYYGYGYPMMPPASRPPMTRQGAPKPAMKNQKPPAQPVQEQDAR